MAKSEKREEEKTLSEDKNKDQKNDQEKISDHKNSFEEGSKSSGIDLSKPVLFWALATAFEDFKFNSLEELQESFGMSFNLKIKMNFLNIKYLAKNGYFKSRLTYILVFILK